MTDLNQCSFIGRLGSDPEMSSTKSGKSVARFSLAVSKKWLDERGNRVERTEWVNIVAFSGLAEIMGKYLRKGSQVFIQGELQSNKYTGKDGVERIGVSIVADSMQMLGSGSQNQGSTKNQAQKPPAAPPQNNMADDDMPF